MTHPVQIVNDVIEKIDPKLLISKYSGGGTSSYHPKMMSEVLVYSYLTNIYSSRKIEAALQENIHFMWLSGMQTPDHNTINNFRGQRLKGEIKDIFSQVVQLLAEEGLISFSLTYHLQPLNKLSKLYVTFTKVKRAV